MSTDNPFILDMRRMIARARVRFFRDALPLARTDDDLTLIRSLAAAIGEISPEEGMAALMRELATRRTDDDASPHQTPESR